MNIEKDLIVEGSHGKPVLLDTLFPDEKNAAPIIVFAHGFKGFKDWGHWHLIAAAFAKAGFIFVKFNFSHNGTTTDHPKDFADLEAFGQNNFSKELSDLDAVINWIEQQSWAGPATPIGMIGHSRGGGIGVIKAANDKRIKALATWAAVSRLDYGWRGNDALIKMWQEKGVQFAYNGRTKQNMPLYFQLFEDFEANAELLDIESALQKRADLDLLIVHGSEDPAVPFSSAEDLHRWHSKSKLHKIEQANHVFGGSHPFTATELPSHSIELVEQSIEFFKKALS